MRGRAVFAGMLAAHMALFVLLAFALRPPTTLVEPAFAIAPVYLADLRRRPQPKPRPQPEPAAAPRSVLSRPAEAPGPAVPAAPGPEPPSSVDAEGQQLARALRGSRVGCANPDLLSEAEQLRCQDRLEAGSKLAKHIPTPLPPERRAYYDAVVKAKGDMRKMAVVGEHGPAVACKLAFGGPKGTGGWKKHPHGLKLGPLPCYVVPPMGPLSVEADITNPDTVIRDSKKATER